MADPPKASSSLKRTRPASYTAITDPEADSPLSVLDANDSEKEDEAWLPSTGKSRKRPKTTTSPATSTSAVKGTKKGLSTKALALLETAYGRYGQWATVPTDEKEILKQATGMAPAMLGKWMSKRKRNPGSHSSPAPVASSSTAASSTLQDSEAQASTSPSLSPLVASSLFSYQSRMPSPSTSPSISVGPSRVSSGARVLSDATVRRNSASEAVRGKAENPSEAPRTRQPPTPTGVAFQQAMQDQQDAAAQMVRLSRTPSIDRSAKLPLSAQAAAAALIARPHAHTPRPPPRPSYVGYPTFADPTAASLEHQRRHSQSSTAVPFSYSYSGLARPQVVPQQSQQHQLALSYSEPPVQAWASPVATGAPETLAAGNANGVIVEAGRQYQSPTAAPLDGDLQLGTQVPEQRTYPAAGYPTPTVPQHLHPPSFAASQIPAGTGKRPAVPLPGRAAGAGQGKADRIDGGKDEQSVKSERTSESGGGTEQVASGSEVKNGLVEAHLSLLDGDGDKREEAGEDPPLQHPSPRRPQEEALPQILEHTSVVSPTVAASPRTQVPSSNPYPAAWWPLAAHPSESEMIRAQARIVMARWVDEDPLDVTFWRCTKMTIGSWIQYQSCLLDGTSDLVVYFCQSRSELVYRFIYQGVYGYRLRIALAALLSIVCLTTESGDAGLIEVGLKTVHWMGFEKKAMSPGQVWQRGKSMVSTAGLVQADSSSIAANDFTKPDQASTNGVHWLEVRDCVRAYSDLRALVLQVPALQQVTMHLRCVGMYQSAGSRGHRQLPQYGPQPGSAQVSTATTQASGEASSTQAFAAYSTQSASPTSQTSPPPPYAQPTVPASNVSAGLQLHLDAAPQSQTIQQRLLTGGHPHFTTNLAPSSAGTQHSPPTYAANVPTSSSVQQSRWSSGDLTASGEFVRAKYGYDQENAQSATTTIVDLEQAASSASNDPTQHQAL